VATIEWHPGELYPRVGFIVTNLARSPEGIVAFYNQRGACEQYIKEGKNAIKWTRLSCRTFAANAARLQLHALAYNLGNFMRLLAIARLGGHRSPRHEGPTGSMGQATTAEVRVDAVGSGPVERLAAVNTRL
jgi:hypothetical protein